MKIKIISEDGVIYAGKNVPKGTVLNLDPGPHTDAFLRFKQAVETKEKPEPEKNSSKEEKSGEKEKK